MASPSTKTDICNMSLGRIGEKLTTVDLIGIGTDPTALKCNLFYEQTRDALLRSHWWRFAGARIEIEASATPTFEWSYAYTLPADFLAMRSIWDDSAIAGQDSIYSYALEGNLLLSNEVATMLSITDGATAGVGITTLTSVGGGFTAAMVDKYIYLKSGTNLTVGWYKITGHTDTNTITLASAPDDGGGGVSGAVGEVGGVIKIKYTKQVTTVADFDPLFIEVFVLSLALKLALPLSQDLKMYESVQIELRHLMSKVRAMDKQEQNTKGIYDYNTWLAAFRTSRDPTKLGSA